MALKKVSKESNEKLIKQASIETVLNGKKVWESDVLERYIKEGFERDKKNNLKIRKS